MVARHTEDALDAETARSPSCKHRQLLPILSLWEESEGVPVTKQLKFGRWHFDTEEGVLTFKSDSPDYEIPLWQIDGSAKILEWIYQIADETWVTPTDLKDLIDAFVHIFGRRVCSRGTDHPFNAKHLLTTRFSTKF